tara:strand:- start:95 stop:493 length:399 start_codon:yes stop_codon:yes gene_type:complete
MYADETEESRNISPEGDGIDLVTAIKDMMEVGVISAGLYDDRYLNSIGAQNLIDTAKTNPGELTVNDLNFLANTLGSTLFIHFIARQLDSAQTQAWDTGVNHAIEVRSNLKSLFKVATVIMDNPELEGKVAG